MRLLTAALAFLAVSAIAGQRIPFNPAEKKIEVRIDNLRQVPDAQRGAETRAIATDIRGLPRSDARVLLAYMLANLSTEGDFGRTTVQAVADTLAAALTETPQRTNGPDGDGAYVELAELARYEHAKVELHDANYQAAVKKLTAMHDQQAKADFSLRDITGKRWTRSELRGKVVLVNFWATWCPPCRKEMPDLERLYQKFSSQGLVVLAITDEPLKTVQPFVAKQGYTFPILLDPGRTVNKAYLVQGIPNSFIYDRHGRLAAQAIDMRTRGQFLKLLAQAGLHIGPAH